MSKSLWVGHGKGDIGRQQVVMVTEKHPSHLREADPTHLELAVAPRSGGPILPDFLSV